MNGQTFCLDRDPLAAGYVNDPYNNHKPFMVKQILWKFNKHSDDKKYRACVWSPRTLVEAAILSLCKSQVHGAAG